MENQSAMKRNGLLTHGTVCLDFKGVILRERTQFQKIHDSFYVKVSKRQNYSDRTEQRLPGERGGERGDY